MEFHRLIEIDKETSKTDGDRCFMYMHGVNKSIVVDAVPFTPVITKLLLVDADKIPTDLRNVLTNTDYTKNILVIIGFPTMIGWKWYNRVIDVAESKNLPPAGDRYTTARINTTAEILGNPDKYLSRPLCAYNGCGAHANNRCSRCMKVKYCGPICQKADWNRHKDVCFPSVASK
jgi:hypothetical protein